MARSSHLPALALAVVVSCLAAGGGAARAGARPDSWIMRTSRMEGASVDVEEAAAALHETAARIEAGGRLDALAELLGDVRELNRRVVSASLAAEVLDQPIED